MKAVTDRQAGSAMIAMMLFIVVVGTFTTAMMQGGRSQAEAAVHDRASLRALHAAEGGVAQARWRLQQDAGYRGELLVIGGIDVEVVVERCDDRPDRRDVRVQAVVAMGSRAVSRRGLQVRVELGDGLPRVVGWRETQR